MRVQNATPLASITKVAFVRGSKSETLEILPSGTNPMVNRNLIENGGDISEFGPEGGPGGRVRRGSRLWK